jgi:hypothetical protein
MSRPGILNAFIPGGQGAGMSYSKTGILKINIVFNKPVP